MRPIYKSITLLAFVLPAIAACGGGGGGGGVSTAMDMSMTGGGNGGNDNGNGSGGNDNGNGSGGNDNGNGSGGGDMSGTGGGGGMGGGGSGTTFPTIPGGCNLGSTGWCIDRMGAQNAVPGSGPHVTSPPQAGIEIRAIRTDSTHFILSDYLVLYGPTLTSTNRLVPQCSQRSCSTTFNEVVFTTGLDESTTDADRYRPVMIYNGVELVEARDTNSPNTPAQMQRIIYGGWLEHSVFAAELIYAPDFTNAARDAGAASYSFGNSPDTAPASRAGYTGTWEGVMVGVGYGSSNREDFYHGEATLEMDFTAMQVDVTFSDVRKLYESDVIGGNWAWENLGVTGAGTFIFGGGGNQLEGRFYGQNHEEVGGRFERNEVLGAFGAKREEESQ